jgi:cytoskeletal protein RodZ
MYGLPDSFDASVLVARILEQICFTENQVTLQFDGAVDITVESALMHGDRRNESSHQVIRVPVQESNLMRLLGSSVVASSSNNEGTLKLIFSNGDVLQILDDSEDYESYQLRIGETVIVV